MIDRDALEGTEAVTWDNGGPYPPDGIYDLYLEDGRKITRPMSSDWVWDDTFGGARIDKAVRREDNAPL